MIFVTAEGLSDWSKYFEALPQAARTAARLAVNQTAERQGLKLARDAMLQQVAWPTGYLTELINSEPRFGIAKRATNDSLVASLRGRFQPTSLARFTRQQVARRTTRRSARARAAGITVMINPGKPVTLKRAFLINLRNGNRGLAIRLRPGEVLANTIGAKLITSGPLKGVALLYGPSVEQVFRTVATDITPELQTYLETEFLRQFIRLSRGANG
jgi:hypothetical protein